MEILGRREGGAEWQIFAAGCYAVPNQELVNRETDAREHHQRSWKHVFSLIRIYSWNIEGINLFL